MGALVVTPEGFPLAYEVMPGNTADIDLACELVAALRSRLAAEGGRPC